jgi:hypothetical protein
MKCRLATAIWIVFDVTKGSFASANPMNEWLLFHCYFTVISLLFHCYFTAHSLLRFQAESHFPQRLRGDTRDPSNPQLKFPAFFPVNGSFSPETGSQETASSAS